jgi:hypothetical protein
MPHARRAPSNHENVYDILILSYSLTDTDTVTDTSFSKSFFKRRAPIMAKPIQWETSLTTAKAKSKKEKKLILMDFYNNL